MSSDHPMAMAEDCFTTSIVLRLLLEIGVQFSGVLIRRVLLSCGLCLGPCFVQTLKQMWQALGYKRGMVLRPTMQDHATWGLNKFGVLVVLTS